MVTIFPTCYSLGDIAKICSFIFMDCLNHNNQADIIKAFNSTYRYVILNIDNHYFKGMVNQIYPLELQLNKANTTDTKAPLLDLYIANGFVSS